MTMMMVMMILMDVNMNGPNSPQSLSQPAIAKEGFRPPSPSAAVFSQRVPTPPTITVTSLSKGGGQQQQQMNPYVVQEGI